MEDFEKRMVLEYHELDGRTEKLNVFLNFDSNAEKRKNVCAGQLEQMHRQLWAMKACGLCLFKELPYINSRKVVTKDSWGYIPSLYYFEGSWVVDWLRIVDGDRLVSFSGETPEEAIQKAYDFSKKDVIWKETAE